MVKSFTQTTKQFVSCKPIGVIVVAMCLTAGVTWGDTIVRESHSPVLFALLIGVDQYPNLPDNAQLKGSRNDVELVASLLRERFRFPAENIETLVDDRATGDSIRFAFDSLVSRLQALPSEQRAYVVFHFSGHGSQLPDQSSGALRDEPDGLDETILPSDSTAHGGDIEIRDDELNDFAHRVCSGKNRHLWMILDCCHSGTGVRGTQATRFRQLSRRPLAARPPAATETLRERELPANAVALYACQSVEKEPEFTEGELTFGLLTKSLAEVLTRTKQVSSLTYARLTDLIESKYRADRRIVPAPKPGIEGEKDSIVCGAAAELDHADWRVLPDAGDPQFAWIQAGELEGITTGSLFEMRDPQRKSFDSAETPIRWLGVSFVTPSASRAQIFRSNGLTLDDATWPASCSSGIAIERYHEPGDVAAQVRVMEVHANGSERIVSNTSQIAWGELVRNVFESTSTTQNNDWLRWVSEDAAYDLVLKLDGTQAALFPAIAMSYVPGRGLESRANVPDSLRGGWGPFDLTNGAAASRKIREAIYRITRARNLMQLTDGQPANSPIDMQLHLQRLEVRNAAIASREPWVNKRHGLDRSEYPVVVDEDCYDWQITYNSRDRRPAHLTVLQINSDMGIQLMIPAAIGDPSPRIRDGERVHIGGYQCCRDDNDQLRVGPRWTIAIVTYSPNQYSWLGQNSLTRIRGGGLLSAVNRGAGRSILDQRLLREACFQNRGESTSTDFSANYDPTWAVAMKTWMAVANRETPP